jgi:hypothetical protein
MITDTIQNALKRLFCSIGGNADNVRNKDDINAILDEMTALNIGKKISIAGTNVVANPTLAGTEADLEGLQVGDTKYKVDGGGGLPSVGTSDNGKILKVVAGEWAVVTDILVLHGTLTSANGGTITETPQELMDAITKNKRIIFAITMPTTDGTADYNVDCTVTKVENSKPYAYGTCSTDANVLLAVYIGEVNDSLIFEAVQYTLTPYSP